MRIRCKLQGASAAVTHAVDLPSPGATLSDLLRALSCRLGVSPDALTLSLNGRDPLLATTDATTAAGQGELAGATPLATIGLVSGDLVYVRCPPGADVGSIAGAATAAAAPSRVESEAPASTSLSVGVPILVGDIGDRPTTNHGQQQLCPSLQLLHSLYYHPSSSGSSIDSRLRRLFLALHCLMVETGFVAVDPATGLAPHQWVSEEDPVIAANRVLTKYLLPPMQFAGAAAVSCAVHYRYCLAPESATVLLKVVNAGGRLAICYCMTHGVAAAAAATGEDAVAMETTEDNSIMELLVSASSSYSLDRFVPSPSASGGGSSYANLRKLSVHFKDSIAERAKSAIHEAYGLPLRGLTGLPTELLLRVLRNCPSPGAVCALGQTCRRLRLLHTDNYVWRALLVRDYGGRSDRVGQYLTAERQGHEVNYYEAYRVFYQELTQRRRMLARLPSRELALPAAAAALHDIMPGVLPPFNLPPLQQPLLPMPERPDLPLRPPRPPLGPLDPRWANYWG